MSNFADTLEALAREMEALAKDEDSHSHADALLVRALESVGEGAGTGQVRDVVRRLVAAYEALPKWYA